MADKHTAEDELLTALRPFRHCTRRNIGEHPSGLLYGLYCGGRDVEIRYEDLYRLAAAYRKARAALSAAREGER